MLYKLQIVDNLTKNTLIEEEYKDLYVINRLIEHGENPKVAGFLLNDKKNKRAYGCEYVSHLIINSEKDTIYRMFYKTKCSKLQTLITN